VRESTGDVGLNLIERIGHSRKASFAAALFVILAAAFGYAATVSSGQGSVCDVKRALLETYGTPVYNRATQLSDDTYSAKVYLEIARKSSELDQKREYAHLAILSVNAAIGKAIEFEQKSKVNLWPYPSDPNLKSNIYYAKTFQNIENLERRQLRIIAQQFDNQFDEHTAEFGNCNFASVLGDWLGLLAVLFTFLSVSLISIREYHNHA
tara:strand:- start:8 stop:634 length:627 start_codon:yes stop_codon:yes gene_type:complete